MILGVDPGLASFGWAVTASDLTVHSMGCWRTKKDTRKVLVSEDNVRRARQLTMCLQVAMERHSVYLVCAEAMSFPRQASNAGKLSMAWGVLVAECEWWNVPIVQASPQDIKRTVTGSKSATKADVIMALMDTPGAISLPKHSQEHAYDALGAVFACRHTDIFRAATREAA